MSVAIVDYNAGNVCSVTFALERLGVETCLTADPEKLLSAERVIFPGVGRAGAASKCLKESKLEQVIREIRAPFLGICVGFQLMCHSSEEDCTEGLKIFDLVVKKFPSSNDLKVPHMGWNKVTATGPLFSGVPL